jgi:quercetin dioxygenase-like cupin family protein
MVLRLCLAGLAIAASLPAENKIEIDNAWVRVLRVKQGPHEKSPAQQHPDSVAVYLTDVANHKAGDVAWMPAGSDTRDNPSDHPAEYVLVELKPGAPKAKGWPVELDPVKLEPAHEKVLLENARVRVLRTTLEPHLKGPEHDHPSYVVVYLTELHTTMTLADGKQVDNPRHPGDIAWRDAYRHTTENIGERTAVEIQVELK